MRLRAATASPGRREQAPKLSGSSAYGDDRVSERVVQVVLARNGKPMTGSRYVRARSGVS
jgi:hypothetical protein